METGSSPRVFVGRERELAELRSGLAEAAAGRGRLFLVSGEPGIGKTRLAGEAASLAHASAARVLWGRCWEGGGAPAYWPWTQILRSCLPTQEPQTLALRLGPGIKTGNLCSYTPDPDRPIPWRL